MKNRFVHLSDNNIDKISHLNDILSNSADNSAEYTEEHHWLINTMNKLVANELTQMQRYCLTEHFLNQKKQKQIAKELGVAPSTVCRHISRAMRKLKNIASYYN